MKKILSMLFVLASLLILSSCTLELPFELPEVELPDFIQDIIGTEDKEDGTEDDGQDDTDANVLANAVSFLKQFYMGDKTVTPSDYNRIGKIQSCTISWEVEVVSGDVNDVKVVKNEDGSYTIDVNEKAASDVVYILVATVTAPDGTSQKVEFNRTVPGFAELSYAEYAAAAKGDAVVVRGIIVGILSKELGDSVDGLYLHTSEGGFYVYGVANTADVPMSTYKLGQEVRATGTMDIYNGTLEVKDGTIEMINETPVAYSPVDLTDAYLNAASLTDESIVGKQAMLVTLKGVTLTSIEESNGYYKFQLGNLESYLRISSSTCPLNAADTATFKSEFAAHLGWTANVSGVVSVYNGAFYLQPCSLDDVEYLGFSDKTDAEAVAWAEENLSISNLKFANGKEVQLPVVTDLYDVNIAWASSNLDVIALGENGIATVIALTEDTTVTLTATLTKGDVTATVTFDVTVKGVTVGTPSAVELTDTELGLDAYADGKATIGGVEFEWVELGSYGNGIQMRNKVASGGKVSKLWNNIAFPSAIESIVLVYNSEKSTYDNADAFEFKFGNAADNLTESVKLSTVKDQKEYTVTPTGEHTYFSMELLLTYSFYWDSITITFGSASSETPEQPTHEHELCAECGKCLKADCPEDKCAGHEEQPDVPGVITVIADALSANEGDAVELTGTVSKIYYDYNEQYNNISVYIKDAAGSEILLFRLVGKVALGDTIKVTGTVTLYNTTRQIAAGCTYEMITVHTCEYSVATCVTPATCSKCGVAKDAVLADHDYANGICKVCNAADPDYSGEVIELATASLSFSSTSNRTVFNTSQQVWSQNGVTLTNDKGSSTSNVADYSNPARFYKSSKLTIECGGNAITKIEFTCNSSSYATALKGSIVADANYTVSVNGSVVTVIFESPITSFVVASLTGGQVRMNSLVVTYQK